SRASEIPIPTATMAATMEKAAMATATTSQLSRLSPAGEPGEPGGGAAGGAGWVSVSVDIVDPPWSVRSSCSHHYFRSQLEIEHKVPIVVTDRRDRSVRAIGPGDR